MLEAEGSFFNGALAKPVKEPPHGEVFAQKTSGHGRQSAQLRLPSENCIVLAMPLGWVGQGTS